MINVGYYIIIHLELSLFMSNREHPHSLHYFNYFSLYALLVSIIFPTLISVTPQSENNICKVLILGSVCARPSNQTKQNQIRMMDPRSRESVGICHSTEIMNFYQTDHMVST